MDSSKEGLFSKEISLLEQKEPAATATDLQLAALHALLASFLSFSRVQPPYLAQGLELFRRGKQQTGTKLAEFCAHALLALDVLIHPRALPLVEYSQCNFQDENVFGQNISNPFDFDLQLQQAGHDGTPDSDDDLCGRWLESGKEANVSLVKDTKYSEAFRENDPKMQSCGTKFQERSECEAATFAEDQIILKSDQPRESLVQPISCASIPVAVAEPYGSVAATESERIVSDSNAPHHVESDQGTSVTKGVELAYPSATNNNQLPTTSHSCESQVFAFKLDHDEDAFPDIVDADPDSDYD